MGLNVNWCIALNISMFLLSLRMECCSHFLHVFHVIKKEKDTPIYEAQLPPFVCVVIYCDI